MKQFVSRALLTAVLAMVPAISHASPISIYAAQVGVYQNGVNNPCIFFQPGGGGCNSNPATFPAWTTDTGQGGFDPYPLVNNFDTAAELLQFGTYVGRDFYIGLDINQDKDPQVLDNFTINFLNQFNVNIGSYTFAPPTAVPDITNGNGFADYILSNGCLGTEAGVGVGATCTDYKPFIAPVGTRAINFTFGLTGFNDGADKVFLITAGPTPVPFDVESVPDGGATIALLGMSMAGLAYARRKFSI